MTWNLLKVSSGVHAFVPCWYNNVQYIQGFIIWPPLEDNIFILSHSDYIEILLICNNQPMSSWWLQMPWCQTGTRASATIMMTERRLESQMNIGHNIDNLLQPLDKLCSGAHHSWYVMQQKYTVMGHETNHNLIEGWPWLVTVRGVI